MVIFSDHHWSRSVAILETSWRKICQWYKIWLNKWELKVALPVLLLLTKTKTIKIINRDKTEIKYR